MKFVHLLSVSVWVGMVVFFTLVATPAIFKSLPREAAGDVVGVLFPKYWAVGYALSFLSLSTLLALSYIGKTLPAARLVLIGFMTVVTLYSGLVVSAKAREVKGLIREAGETAKKEELKKDFRSLHAKSAAMNMAVLLSGVALIFLIAKDLEH